MVDLALLQSVSYIAGALGVCVAAAYYVMNLRISQRNQELTLKAQQQSAETRQAQLFTQAVDKMDEKWFGDFSEVLYQWKWNSFEDFEKKYDPFQNETFRNVFLVMEHLGILVNEGLLSSRLLWFWIGPFNLLLWEKYKPVIVDLRVKYDESFLEFFEDLVIALKKEELRDRVEKRTRLSGRKVDWESFQKVAHAD